MPQITIDIPIAAVPRIQVAFNRALNLSDFDEEGNPTPRDVTVADIKEWLIAQLQGLVQHEERHINADSYVPAPDEDIT